MSMANNYQHQVAKATTAITLGGSLIVLSGVTMVATIIGLVLITPVMVIFSPVLVPAVFVSIMIFLGFLASAWLGATSMYVFYWLFRYVTGKHPVGSNQLDWVRQKVAGAAVGVKHKAEHLGNMAVKEGSGAQNR